MTGQYTLGETERAVTERLGDLPVDHQALAVVGNLYRAAGAVRNHFERSVLARYELSWTGWVVLWVVWVWREIETRHVASEAGITKATLTGVLKTLEAGGVVQRREHPQDARRVLLSLTPQGLALMQELFPRFNALETELMSALDPAETETLNRALRTLVLTLETESERPDAPIRPRRPSRRQT